MIPATETRSGPTVAMAMIPEPYDHNPVKLEPRAEGTTTVTVTYGGLTRVAEEGPFQVAGSAIPGRLAAVYLWGAHNLDEPPGSVLSDRNYHEVGFHEIVLAHEFFHVMEAVDACAPNADGAHVDDHRSDLMYVGVQSVPDRMAVIDRNHDDYDGDDIPGCTDVEDSALWDDASGRMSAALRLAPRILPSAHLPFVCGVR